MRKAGTFLKTYFRKHSSYTTKPYTSVSSVTVAPQYPTLLSSVTHHSINVGNPKYGYRTTSVVAHVFVTDVTANQEIGSPLGEQYGWT